MAPLTPPLGSFIILRRALSRQKQPIAHHATTAVVIVIIHN
jgi:hypothetical protein